MQITHESPVRSELLWRYVNAHLEPDETYQMSEHLGSCESCREALDDERLLAAGRGREAVVLAACPASDELLQYVERDPGLPPFRRLEVKSHLLRCELCREEVKWAAGHVSRIARSQFAGWLQRPWIWAVTAAMLAVLLAMIYPSYWGPRRFARYAQLPDLPYEAVIAEFGAAHPGDLPRFRAAAQLLSLGEYTHGKAVLRDLETHYPDDPSLVFLRGHMAAREGRWNEAALLCQRSEVRDLDGFRCWHLANVALQAGNLPLARHELHHAAEHPAYRDVARRLKTLVD